MLTKSVRPFSVGRHGHEKVGVDAGHDVVWRRGLNAGGQFADAVPQAGRIGFGDQLAFDLAAEGQLLEQRVDRIEHSNGRCNAGDGNQLDVIALHEIRGEPERQPHQHRALQHDLDRARHRHEPPARHKAGIAKAAVGKGEGAQHQGGRQQRRAERQRPDGCTVGPMELPLHRIRTAHLVVKVLVFRRGGAARLGQRAAAIELGGECLVRCGEAGVGRDARFDRLQELGVLRAQRVFGENQCRRRNGEERHQGQQEHAKKVFMDRARGGHG
jgi:hypothetical protein